MMAHDDATVQITICDLSDDVYDLKRMPVHYPRKTSSNCDICLCWNVCDLPVTVGTDSRNLRIKTKYEMSQASICNVVTDQNVQTL